MHTVLAHAISFSPQNGQNALVMAAMAGHRAILDLFVTGGRKDLLTVASKSSGVAPAHAAASKCHSDIITWLAEIGVDITIPTKVSSSVANYN